MTESAEKGDPYRRWALIVLGAALALGAALRLYLAFADAGRSKAA